MITLIDTDVLVYRTGFSVKDGDFVQNVDQLNEYLETIYTQVCATDKKLLLTGSNNFRKQIDPNYKSSRKSEKPKYFYELRDYAVNQLGAEVAEGKEADDLLGIYQGENTIICSSDKDLLTIPGYHLRFKKNFSDNEIIQVTEEEAYYNFFRQVLMGDDVDDVNGLKGIGEVKSGKLLDGKTKEEMIEVCQLMYKNEFGESWYSEFDKNCRLLFIQRKDHPEYYSWIA